MEYIKAGQFLNQPKEVQEAFLNWWNPSIGDLYTYDIENNQDYSELDCVTSINVAKMTSRNKGERIPLFTEGQLRKFIEDKTNGIVKLIQWHIEDSQISKRGYAIDILRKNEYHVTYHYQNSGEDLLQAYWKVACSLAVN